jgi:hypothetical protein
MATKTYTRIFSDSYLPRTRHVEGNIEIAHGMQRCVRVRCVSEGRITKLSVRQKAGESVAFTVEVLKSAYPFPPDTDIPYGTPPAGDLSLFRIIPQQTAAAGDAVELEKDTPGYNFVNLDGTPTNNQRFVYLVIIPEPTNGPVLPTEWEAVISFAMDVPQ